MPPRGHSRHLPMNTRTHPMLQAFWNLRMLALFLLGPILGVGLVGAIFGLPPGLYLLAGAMFLFSLAMLLSLVVTERRRIDTVDRTGLERR
jgi:hypothetical protein